MPIDAFHWTLLVILAVSWFIHQREKASLRQEIRGLMEIIANRKIDMGPLPVPAPRDRDADERRADALHRRS